MGGAVLSLPQYALMAWCSEGAQGQLFVSAPTGAVSNISYLCHTSYEIPKE
jgi:hypothetical protein